MKFAPRILALSAALSAPLVQAQAQTHIYTFSTGLCDQSSAACLTGSGSVSGGNYNFGYQQGLRSMGVFNSGGYAGGAYSIVMRAAVTDLPATNVNGDGFHKIIDFKGLSTDDGLYLGEDGDAGTTALAGIYLPSDFAETGYNYNAGMHTTVFTNNGLGTVKIYTDGVFQTSLSGIGSEATFDTGSGTAWFFQDDGLFGVNQYSAGSLDYLAIYNHPIEFGEDANFGPTAAPEPASLVLLGTGLFGIAAFSRRRRNKA